MPSNWMDIVAEVTRFYRWGPRDAWGLTWSRLSWWRSQMLRMCDGGS